MKVLWLSNCVLTTQQTASTGTWLQTMSAELTNKGNVELYNITFGNVSEVTQCDCGSIGQWVVPMSKSINGLPTKDIVNAICDIAKQVSPDLIHVWGVEFYWGLLSARGILKYPTLLEIQGLRYTCADAYYASMSAKEILASITLTDLIFAYRRIDRQKQSHTDWGKYEKEMLFSHEYISTQSKWVRSIIKPYCGANANIFETKMALRPEFLASQPWQYPEPSGTIQLLSITSMAVPYKGVHMALKAVALLKERYPLIKMKLVGDYMQQRSNLRKIGYVRFLERLIKKLGIKENVEFVGPMSAPELVREMHKSHAVVHSSFVESYSLSLAESMAVGVPCVISYAGGMIELAEDEVSGLFYSPSDYRECASQIERLILDKELSLKISLSAYKLARERNCTDDVIATQLEIYSTVLEMTKKSKRWKGL